MYSCLILFILILFSSFGVGWLDNICSIVPKDPYIAVGSNATIVCRSSCVPGEVFWTLNDKLVDGSLSQRIENSSDTVLQLRNFNYERATLLCHSVNNQQVLRGTTIRTFTRPRKLSCILHSENYRTLQGLPDKFTCSWEHHSNSSLKINYTVLLISPDSEQKKLCESHATNCTTKYVNGVDKNISLLESSTVIVRAETTAWQAESDPYNFDPLHILKIIPRKVHVTAFSDHLLVKWNQLERGELGPCQVKYRKAFGEETPEVVDIEALNITIKNVESCTDYHVSVRCALKHAPWSNWSQEKTVRTKLRKRDVNLHLWRTVSEPENSGVRNVHVMWKANLSRCEGTFNYTVKLMPPSEAMYGVNYASTLCENSSCDITVDQHAHRIILTIFHDDAVLAQGSFYVPAIAESFPQVTDIQTFNLNRSFLVMWRSVPDVTGYMIHWTHDGNDYHWKESKFSNATLFDLLDKTPYNMTVTPLFADKIGHGTQVSQICSRVGDPGNVTITTVQTYDRSAQVSWNIKSQEVCSGVVVNYTIFYGTQLVPEFNVTVDSARESIVLKNLDPNTQYRVQVKATGPTGTTTSNERLFETKRFDPGLIIVLSISGSIIIILILSLGLCCGIQWKKFNEKPVPNPGLSSVALWPSTGTQKGTCALYPFSNPSESICERVYTEEPLETPTPPPPATTECNPNVNPVSNQTEDITDPGSVAASDPQCETQADTAETPQPSSPGENTALLPVEGSPFNPYRSQNAVEISATKTSRQRLLPMKPQTVYVTLDMFEQRR
ncbi:interleukin-31 receptor subunit alpha-like [Sphaeramia orbicularis]|uniref:Interleukin-31 receptor subunit alpha-like n=1 Tax=Sphaeramia orbicularis TaxID=375764 RepID=A0A673AT99_9TELE|nr:interleukin-31 receptor subunit alpha-like [Sphaeramia orbicularis]